jgi:hypothetical protein
VIPIDNAPAATSPTPGSSASAAATTQSFDDDEPAGHGSFIDRLIRRIARLPLGGWWVYPMVLIASASWATAVRWMTGVAPIGSVDPKVVTFTVFLPYAIAVVHYLDVRAERALAIFTPALGGSEREIISWRRELTSLPPRPAAAAAIGGALFGVLILAGTPPSIYRLFSPDLPTTALLVGWIIVLSFGATAIVLYHTWHQLRAVRAIHAAAAEIDPFRQGSLFAFSVLTAQTGLSYLLILYYSATINGEFTAATPALFLYGVYLVPTLACFVLPLIGMHGRLTEAKAELLAESDARIKAAKDELYRRVDTSEFTGAGHVKDALEGLTVIRDQVVRLPTWPWSPQLLGGYVTALLLPIIIWFITRALASVLHV